MIFISFTHIILYLLLRKKDRISRHDIQKLLTFYVVTVIGSVVSLFYTGMPGTWTCAAISIMLIYLDDQNREVLHGMITAMAADYRSIHYADLDKDECICVRTASRQDGKSEEGKTVSFRDAFAEYAERCVAETDREAFLRFVDPENIRAGLENEAMLSHRYLTRKDGAEQYELLRIAGVRPIEECEDHIVHAIGAGFSDVDRETRKELEQKQALTEALARAEEASAAKTAFLSSMSHELRTPMNAIIGLNTIALRDPSLSRDTRGELEKAGSSARHLLSLINDILDMSHAESGSIELKTEEFSLPELIEQVDAATRSRCEEKGLAYESLRSGCTEASFLGDAQRLKQVILNILDNAVKFTDAPGSVSFSVEQAAASNDLALLRFTVKDTGIGIDEAFLPRLYEPFTQEDAAITSRYGGSGLGMAIAKSMVDLMGGKISVESVMGRGTACTVEIPLKQAPHHETPDEPEQAEAGGSIAGLHALIADDIEINAEALADLLEMEDVTSEWAENGQLAVDLFAQSEAGHFDFILMDLRMPVMDGLTAAREIRKLDRPDAARIPIIALTANTFEEDVKQCLQAGMNAHMSKPADIELIKRTLAGMLGEA